MADFIKEFLLSLKLEQYVDNFLQNGYDDGSCLKTIDDKDLDAMGITLPGHRKRLLQNGSFLAISYFRPPPEPHLMT